MDVLTIARRPVLASEKVVEHRCDVLVAKISGKQAVVRFSQARASNQTEGISDRLYQVFEVDLWFEVKSEKPDAQLTRKQSEFLRARLAAGVHAACGTVTELVQVMTAIRERNRALDICHRIVQHWEARGFRGEKKPRTTSRSTPRLDQEKTQ